jgi:hypothetical protein
MTGAIDVRANLAAYPWADLDVSTVGVVALDRVGIVPALSQGDTPVVMLLLRGEDGRHQLAVVALSVVLEVLEHLRGAAR